MGNWKILYEGAIVAWIIFGLGYVFMIINIITDGIRRPAKLAAKKFHRAEKALIEKVLKDLVTMKSMAKVLTTRLKSLSVI
jgi:hypothetical protein